MLIVQLTDCDLDVRITSEAQCIKCADLASDSGNSQQDQNDVAVVLIGNQTNNVFTICNDTATAKAEFNATIADSAVANQDLVTDAFSLCVDNAAASTNPTPSGLAQAQISSLQENSLTANVKPEAEIPSLNTEAQNPDLIALLEHPNLKALLENPELEVMIENNDVNALLEDPNVKALLEDSEVNALLEDPAIKAQLEKSK